MDDSGIGVASGTIEPPLYHETQRFRHWYFYIPVLVVVVAVWYQFIRQIVLDQPLGEQPVPNWVAWALTIVFGLGFPVFVAVVRLVTEVRPGSVSVRLFPFRPRKIPLTHVKAAEIREYSPLREFGGWGIRYSRRNGRAYNAYGNQGVQLVLKDEQLVLIGTQQPEQLLAALRTGRMRTPRT